VAAARAAGGRAGVMVAAWGEVMAEAVRRK